MNLRLIVSKIDEFDEIIKFYNISLICIIELWLIGNIFESCVMFEGFIIYWFDWEGCKGGGICVWIKLDIIFFEVLRYFCDDYESLWLKVCFVRFLCEILLFFIGVIYCFDNIKD